MKKLFAQIIKFGFVGGLSFIIDFVITMIVAALMRKLGIGAVNAAAVGGFFGFVISVIFNYILSMKIVFERREDISRKREFIVFVSLSVIGLGLNELIIIMCMGAAASIAVFSTLSDNIATAGSKVIATAIVMVYNFVTRKIFLEKKD